MAVVVVDASNAWCYRKRLEAGYVDDPADDAPAPSPDVALGATLYAVALWRERASVDGYQSFEDLGSYQPVGGALGQIRRLLAVGRGRVDTPLSVAEARARRRAILFPPTAAPLARHPSAGRP
jgi:hypothetical protein